MASTEIEGEYYRNYWAKEDGSWLVAALKDGTNVVGAARANMFIRGVTYRFSGKWVTHPQYGRQFKFDSFVAKQPVTPESVNSYLEKYLYGKNTGIGVSKGKKLIAEFGAANALSVIKVKPERVAEVAGVSLESAKQAAALLIAVEKNETTRLELVQLFKGRGFSQTCIEDCIEAFGVLAVERIKRDPFTLLVRRMNSAGFLRCDQLYRDLGLPEGRLKRQMICLWHQINTASGSVWINEDTAANELRRLISSRVEPKRAVELGTRANWISRRRDEEGVLWIAESAEARYEHIIKKRLGALLNGETNRKPIGGIEHTFEIQSQSAHGRTGDRENHNAG